eukprot:Lithocolla_globosa_v1_NODE_8967_length_761_cov_131.483003.p1 type:complete len:157 gc:universal NODE_8967_length_761_cov_131.483003:664-194(-)
MYTNGKIFKIVSDEIDSVFIGSTCQPLYKVKSDHKCNYIKWLENGKQGRFSHSYDIIKYGDYDVILIEEYECDNRDQLLRRERFWMEELREKCINFKKSRRTEEEDEIKRRNPGFVFDNETVFCECGLTYKRKHRGRHQRTKIHENNMNELLKLFD